MAAKKTAQASLFDSARIIYDTLEPLDADTRKRVLSSALSLLGLDMPDSLPPASALQPAATTVTAATVAAATARPMSPVELVQAKQPSTNAQKIAVFAYYREKYEGVARFARADLKPYFAKAKAVAPQNFDRDFGAAVKLGYIYEDGADSYLTSKGLEAVEAGFDGKQPPRGAKPAGTKRRGVARARRSAKR